MCEKLTPSSSNNGGSPSYPSVENAASQPVLNPPCSPIRPDTPGPAPKPAPYDVEPEGPPYPYDACEGVACPDTAGEYEDG